MFTRDRLVMIAGAGVAVLLIAVLLWWLLASGDCGNDDEARVKALALSADMQAAAQQGKLTIEELASTTRRVNQAATAYSATNDRGAYCKALDTIRDDVKLAP